MPDLNNSEIRLDAAVVGAGPAGLFAALELVRLRADLQISVLDSGPDLKSRVAKVGEGSSHPWSGFGGAGFFIGGRLALDGESLSSMPSNVDRNEGLRLMAGVDGLLKEWGAGGTYLDQPPPELKAGAERAHGVGLHWHLNYPARHLSAEDRMRALTRIEQTLVGAGVTFRANMTVDDMKSEARGWHLLTGGSETFHAATVVFAPGRGGAPWLAAVLERAGWTVTSRVSIGVRVEVPSEVLAPLTDLTPDPRLSMETSSGRFRTYACAKGAYVHVVETHGTRRISLRPGGATPSPNTSFSVLWEPPATYAPPHSMQPSVFRVSDVFSEISSQREPFPLPTMDLQEGQVHTQLWPHEYWSGLREFLTRLDSLAPGICDGGNLLYAPAIERYWEYRAPPDATAEIPGIFLAGDGACLSQGAMAAAISGVAAARSAFGRIRR